MTTGVVSGSPEPKIQGSGWDEFDYAPECSLVSGAPEQAAAAPAPALAAPYYDEAAALCYVPEFRVSSLFGGEPSAIPEAPITDPGQTLEEEARAAAVGGQLYRATRLGQRRIAAGNASPEFVGEVAQWADRDGNLVLAKELCGGDHGAKVPENFNQRYEALLKDAGAWTDAAGALLARGRLTEAREHLRYAEQINEGYPTPGDIYLGFFVTEGEPDRGLGERIATLQSRLSETERGLKARLSSERVALESAVTQVPATELPHELARLERLRAAEQAVARLEELKTKLPQVRHLATAIDEFKRAAQAQIVAGALENDQELYSEGIATLLSLERYLAAEARQVEVAQKLYAKYPVSSRLPMELDYSAANPRVRPYLTGSSRLSDYEPSIAHLADLPIVRAYQGLAFEGPQGWLTAYHVDEVYTQLHRGPFGGEVASIHALDQYSGELERLYQDPRVEQFFTAVAAEELQDLRANEGFENRQALAEGLAHLEKYQASLSVLESAKPTDLDPDSLERFRALMVERGTRYHEHLAAEVTRLHRLEDKDRPLELVGDADGMTTIPDSNWVGPRERAAQEALAQLDYDLTALKSLDLSKPDDVTVLVGLTRRFAAHEETNVRSRLAKQADQVDALPSQKGDLKALRERIASVGGADLTTRVAAYRTLSQDLDTTALERTVDVRIKMYAEMGDTVKTTDRIFNGVMWIGSMGDNPLRSDRAADYRKLAGRYRDIQGLIAAGKVDEAQRALVALETAQIGDKLTEYHEFASTFNTYTVGVGIVIAAGFTAGVAAELLLPGYIGAESLTLGEAALLYGTMGTTFAVTQDLLWMAASGDVRHVYDPEKGILGNALTRAEKSALSAGMFGFLGGSLRLFSKYAERQLLRVAEQRLIAEGALKPGQKILSGSAEEALLVERAAALRKSLAVRYGLKGGAFGTEFGGFTAWEFLQTNYELAKAGTFDPLSAAAHTLGSGQAWTDRFVFLVALKAGGTLASPLTKPMHDGARELALAGHREALAAVEGRVQVATARLERLVESGEGDVLGLASEYRAALTARRAVMDKIPILRDPQTYALTDHALQEIDRFESDYRAHQELFGEGNTYGAVLTGATTGRVEARHTDAFVARLKEHPRVDNVQVHDNGLIEFAYRETEGGQGRTLRFHRHEPRHERVEQPFVGPERPIPSRDYSAYEPGALVEMPLADIIPTQELVFVDQVGEYLGGDAASANGVAEVRIIDGRVYVSDGHHRLMAEYLKTDGQGAVTVKIKGPDSDEARFGLTPVLHTRFPHLNRWDQLRWRADEQRSASTPVVVSRAEALRRLSAGPNSETEPLPVDYRGRTRLLLDFLYVFDQPEFYDLRDELVLRLEYEGLTPENETAVANTLARMGLRIPRTGSDHAIDLPVHRADVALRARPWTPPPERVEPLNPRRVRFSQTSVRSMDGPELQIARHGELEPIVVMRVGNNEYVSYDNSRLLYALRNGLEEIPVMIVSRQEAFPSDSTVNLSSESVALINAHHKKIGSTRRVSTQSRPRNWGEALLWRTVSNQLSPKGTARHPLVAEERDQP